MGVIDRPTVADKYSVHADVGGNASIIIPFQNPFFEDVIVDVELKENLLPNEGFYIFAHLSLIGWKIYGLISQGDLTKYVFLLFSFEYF